MYICICTAKALRCAVELKATLISHTAIWFSRKEQERPRVPLTLSVSFLLTPAPCFLCRECLFFSWIPNQLFFFNF